MTIFFRLVDTSADDKSQALLGAIQSFGNRDPRRGSPSEIVYECDPIAFAVVSGSPFAYWVSALVRNQFRASAALQRNVTATVGLQSSNDFRFLRLWWETREGTGFRCFAKGGAFSPYYSDVSLQIGWSLDGRQAKAFAETTPGSKHWSRNIRSAEHYFRPGLTWPLRTTSSFGPRVMPAGCIFAHMGPAAFVDGDDTGRILPLLAILNSTSFSYLMGIQLAAADAAARSYEVGLVQKTPVPEPRKEEAAVLARLAQRAWCLKRRLDTVNETSHAFLLPFTLAESVTGLDANLINRELDNIQHEIDDRAFELYGIGPEDRAAIETSTKGMSSTSPDDEEGEIGDDADNNESPLSATAETKISWLVGVAFGRFDYRLATGERPIPPEPEPFDPLPSRSPGMWPENEKRTDVPPDIMVDDEGHAEDIRALVGKAAAKTGCSEREDLRQWLAREFFPLHVKMYSKSRRKAPIYWQLATPSASYSVWLYIHAFTKDTMFRVQNDYAGPKLAHEERKLESMAREANTVAERRALAVQESFVEELRGFLDEVKRVAPLWNPNLDDGVIINFAPLWRLVPQHKSWQKDVKATWDSLCKGEYDWAHLAMHLWPERVVPKCATDRSLAIAHGLEDVFWSEGTDGKWKARSKPTKPVADLVQERTSTAVKAALKSLLDAPVASGGTKKPRKGKSNA